MQVFSDVSSTFVSFLITQMEAIIRNAEADRNRSLDLAYSVFKEYNSLKSEIDQGRRQLGLEEVPPLVVEEETLDKQ